MPLGAFLAAMLLALAGCSLRAPDAGEPFRDCPNCPEMVAVPPGRFRMGANSGEDRRPEGPVREVRIGYRFAVGVTEVTQEQFAAFVVATGRLMPGGCRVWDGKAWQSPEAADWTDPGYGGVPFAEEPVTCVSWRDARDYATWLAERTGRKYRLLTEAEWEYVARAGTTSDYYWGAASDVACKSGNVYDAAGAAQNGFDWSPFACDDGFGQASPVGSFAANGFGLRDILGNVGEWTEDCYHVPYPAGPVDGSAAEDGESCALRVLRGGSWSTGPDRQRVSFRAGDREDARYSYYGLRVARDLP